jgi:hypothetical protein
VKDGDLKGTADAVKAGYHTYPLAQASNPPKQIFHNLSGMKFNTIHANDFSFFEEMNEVVQYEPADAFDPEFVGQLAAIGVKKGRPFSPNARMKKLLTEAAAMGNASARAILYAPRKESVFFYEDRQWNSPFAGGSHEFINEGERYDDLAPISTPDEPVSANLGDSVPKPLDFVSDKPISVSDVSETPSFGCDRIIQEGSKS